MKEALTSFDLHVLAQELKVLEGGYLDKVYQDGEVFLLRFRHPKAGKRELYVEPGKWLFLGEDRPKPPQPTTLALSLRKVVGNATVGRVQQRGFDRILHFTLQKATNYTLILEMFGRGNLILAEDGVVRHALRYGKWGSREVRRGESYGPPAEFPDLTSLARPALAQLLAASTGIVVKVLASRLGLGRLYAEETCLRAGVEKERRVAKLEPVEVEVLLESLAALTKNLETPSPTLVSDDGPLDVIPFPLQRYEGYASTAFPTMSEALQAFVRDRPEPVPVDEESARVERRIARQEESLVELDAEIELLSGAVDYLYAHYQEADRRLQAAREEAEATGARPGTNSVRLETEGGEVALDIHQDVDANARRLYERRKALLTKRASVERALVESHALRQAATKRTQRRSRRPTFPPSKRFWFDAYRWTLTRHRFLVLGGRDARSNEKLVRKHLDARDRYCHADLTGAPSVVVKEGADAPAEDLREACAFALIFSKAWAMGVGSGSAFWVTPEQVSKTAESGEFLAPGAFVIRGRRNYEHRLPLQVGIGRVAVEGVDRVLPGEPEGVAQLSSHFVVLSPGGPVRRPVLARQLSEAFQIPPAEVERVLPSGSFAIQRVVGLQLPDSEAPPQA